MSADLEPPPNLPPLRLPYAGTTPAQPTDAAADAPIQIWASSGDFDENEECRTPTGPEYRIPPALTCPPAPKRKRRRLASPCKRNPCEINSPCQMLDQEAFDALIIKIKDSEESEPNFRSAFRHSPAKRRR
ncbi:hypothetical protein NMG60_11018709 [Bertholletia excelsa]